MQVDKHVPPHLLLLSVTTSITNRPHSKAKDNSIKKQLHFSATASEDVVVSSWGQQISAWLGSSNFIMHSCTCTLSSKKTPPSLSGRVTGIGTVRVMTFMRDSANLFWQVLQNAFFHFEDCLTHAPASWLQKHDSAGALKAYCCYWFWSS